MKALLKVMPILLLVASCNALNIDERSDSKQDSDYYVVKANYTGFSPESGEPLLSTYAPVWVYKAIACLCNGSVLQAGQDYPDIFINKSTGTFGDVDDPFSGDYLYYSQYQGKSTEGRLLYSDPVSIKSTPWARRDANVRMINYNGKTYAMLMAKTKVYVAEYNSGSVSFGSSWSTTVDIAGVANSVNCADVRVSDGVVEIYYLCADGTAKSETMEDVYQGYYDAYGSWRGNIGNAVLFRCRIDLASWTQVGAAEQLAIGQELIQMPQGLAIFEDKANNKIGLLYGNKFGVLKYAPVDNPGAVVFVKDKNGRELINHSLINGMMTIPQQGTGSRTDFVTSGEGAFCHYRFTGAYDRSGAPVFNAPEELLSRNHPLYSGSLSVPTVVDWDNDGVLDIISGNSEGRILFFKNYGSNKTPAFGNGDPLYSCGEEVKFHAGYFEVQGPDDGGAWGYICPNVIDWDGDGILDIVTSSNATRIEIMLGNGSGTLDCLGPRMILTLGGSELWGMWRVRPAVTRVDGEIYLAFMDTDDAVHLYRKVSLTSVEDCGQLKMTDGNIITGHRANASTSLGERGRAKLEFADWDGDGVTDLLIGTPGHASFPNPTSGLPEFATQTALHVLFLRNAGTNANMVFEYPKQFQFKHKKVTLGSHAQSPSVCYLGNCTSGPNLLVGCESGRFYFYNRGDLNYLY